MNPAELTFDLAQWTLDHCTLIEQGASEWVVVCPWCGREKCAINVRRKRWRCFTCEFHGRRPVTFVAEVLGCTWALAQEEISRYAVGAMTGPIRPLPEAEETIREDRSLPVAPLPPLRPLGHDQLQYWRSRGFPDAHIDQLGVATPISAGTGGKADWLLPGRLLFPVWNTVGTCVSWAARAIIPARAKVLNAPRACSNADHAPGCTCGHRSWGLPEVPGSASAGEVVLGLHLLRPGDRAIVVEGVTDVAACGAGFVATLGASITDAQAAVLARAGVSSITLMYDPDEAGDKARPQAVRVLSRHFEVRVAELPVGTDPGSLGRDACLRLADQATALGGELRDRPVSIKPSEPPLLPFIPPL